MTTFHRPSFAAFNAGTRLAVETNLAENAHHRPSVACAGSTSINEPCRKPTRDLSGFCRWHRTSSQLAAVLVTLTPQSQSRVLAAMAEDRAARDAEYEARIKP